MKGLLLIAVGTVLFGASAGAVSWDTPHALLHLWPVLLLVGGIELIASRKDASRALAIQTAVLVLAVALSAIAPEWVIASTAPFTHEPSSVLLP